MENNVFDDVYNDAAFRGKVEAMLTTMYRHNATAFEDQGLDLEDFKQEVWAELYEEEKFSPDRAWCYEVMRNKAIDYLRAVKYRMGLAQMFDLDDDRISEAELADDRDYSSADFPVRPRAFS